MLSFCFFRLAANVRRYAQLPLQGAFVSGYPQDKKMNQHEQPLGPAIAYDRLLVVVILLSSLFFPQVHYIEFHCECIHRIQHLLKRVHSQFLMRIY